MIFLSILFLLIGAKTSHGYGIECDTFQTWVDLTSPHIKFTDGGTAAAPIESSCTIPLGYGTWKKTFTTNANSQYSNVDTLEIRSYPPLSEMDAKTKCKWTQAQYDEEYMYGMDYTKSKKTNKLGLSSTTQYQTTWSVHTINGVSASSGGLKASVNPITYLEGANAAAGSICKVDSHYTTAKGIHLSGTFYNQGSYHFYQFVQPSGFKEAWDAANADSSVNAPLSYLPQSFMDNNFREGCSVETIYEIKKNSNTSANTTWGMSIDWAADSWSPGRGFSGNRKDLDSTAFDWAGSLAFFLNSTSQLIHFEGDQGLLNKARGAPTTTYCGSSQRKTLMKFATFAWCKNTARTVVPVHVNLRVANNDNATSEFTADLTTKTTKTYLTATAGDTNNLKNTVGTGQDAYVTIRKPMLTFTVNKADMPNDCGTIIWDPAVEPAMTQKIPKQYIPPGSQTDGGTAGFLGALLIVVIVIILLVVCCIGICCYYACKKKGDE